MDTIVDTRTGSDSRPPGYFDNERREMLHYVPHSAQRILSVGCGSGRFGALLKHRPGVQVWGVEPLSGPAEEAARRLDRVFIRDIEDRTLAFEDHSFDCIVFNDVLEHLRDPWGVLIRSREWLTNEGCVVASVPNVRYLVNVYDLLVHKDWRYTDDGILDATHLRFFTQKSLRHTFADCGYSVITMEGLWPARFSWKVWLLNALLRGSLDDMRYLQFALVARTVSPVGGEPTGPRRDG
jgi:SAM-dependent methyltransferase